MRIPVEKINLIIVQVMIICYFSIREIGGVFSLVWKGILFAYLIYFAIYVLKNRRLKFRINKYYYLVIITLVFSLITLIPGYSHIANSIKKIEDYITIIIYVLSISILVDIRKNCKSILVALFWGGTIAAIYQISRVSFSSLAISAASLYNRFSISEHIHVNTHAYNLFFSLTAGFYLLLDDWKKLRVIYKIIIIFGVTFISVGIFLTGARKEIVCIALFLSILLITGKYKIIKIAAVLLVLFLGFYVVTEVPSLYNTIGWRLQINDTVDKSTQGRIDLILDGVETGLSHPFGVGIDNSRYYVSRAREEDYAHNNYIEFLADFGFLGFLFYYGVVVTIVLLVYKKHRKIGSFESKFWYALLVSICVHDLFQISYYRLAYHLPMLLICTYIETNNEKNT